MQQDLSSGFPSWYVLYLHNERGISRFASEPSNKIPLVHLPNGKAYER